MALFMSAPLTEGKEVIQRANELHGTFHLEKNCVYKKSGAKPLFQGTHATGFPTI